MKKMSEQFSKELIKIYEKNIFWLSMYKLGHFFTRVYKITGNKKYENFLALYLLATKRTSLAQALKTLKQNKFTYISKGSNKSKNKRKTDRESLYKNNPKIPFYNALLNDLFFLEKFNLLKTVFKDDFKKLLPFLKKEDFRKIYLQKEVIKKDSSFAFNSIFYLDYFGIACFKKEAEKELQKIYFQKDMQLKTPLDKAAYCSLIYSLTHIIISESQYYEKYVKTHTWIVRYFKNNLETIIQNTTQDILAEVGLCFKLCRKETTYPKEYQKVLACLLNSLQTHRLEKEAIYFNKKEHTASILVLLFGKFNKFFSGPDLSKNVFLKN